MSGEATCPACGADVSAQDVFCERCGQALGVAEPVAAPPVAATPDQSARTHLIAPPMVVGSLDEAQPAPPACSQCGSAVDPDGWCTVCGARASNGREHVTAQPAPTVAGVSDIGIVHARNEDALALDARSGWAALVVCDGVTTATDSDVAADAAVRAAIAVLSGAPPAATASPAVRVDHWADQLTSAARAADSAAGSAAGGNADNPPSCTFVAAVADGDVIVAGWVGDSRAYWLPDSGPAEQLSVDDSWASAQIAAGVEREVAEAGPRAHAITKWLGADSADATASIATTTVAAPGWLLVCSDGLWNYCSAASDLAALVADQHQGEPLALAEALVAWANDQGGHDNVTVALARLVPPAVT